MMRRPKVLHNSVGHIESTLDVGVIPYCLKNSFASASDWWYAFWRVDPVHNHNTTDIPNDTPIVIWCGKGGLEWTKCSQTRYLQTKPNLLSLNCVNYVRVLSNKEKLWILRGPPKKIIDCKVVSRFFKGKKEKF